MPTYRSPLLRLGGGLKYGPDVSIAVNFTHQRPYSEWPVFSEQLYCHTLEASVSVFACDTREVGGFNARRLMNKDIRVRDDVGATTDVWRCG